MVREKPNGIRDSSDIFLSAHAKTLTTVEC